MQTRFYLYAGTVCEGRAELSVPWEHVSHPSFRPSQHRQDRVRIRHTAHQLNLLLDSLELALLEDLPQDFACGLVRFLRLLIGPEWVRAFIPAMHDVLDVLVKQSLPQAL